MTGAEVMVDANGALVDERVRRTLCEERARRLSPPTGTPLGGAVRQMLALTPEAPDERVLARLRVVIEAASYGDSSGEYGPGAEFRYDAQDDSLAGATSLPADVEARARTEYDRNWTGPRNCQGRHAPPMQRSYVCPSCIADCRTTEMTP